MLVTYTKLNIKSWNLDHRRVFATSCSVLKNGYICLHIWKICHCVKQAHVSIFAAELQRRCNIYNMYLLPIFLESKRYTNVFVLKFKEEMYSLYTYMCICECVKKFLPSIIIEEYKLKCDWCQTMRDTLSLASRTQ